MEKFDFYQDRKVTSWERTFFTVEAEDYDAAINAVKSWDGEDVACLSDDRVSLIENRSLWETSEAMSPEDNNGEATIEIFYYNGDLIAANAPSPLFDGSNAPANG